MKASYTLISGSFWLCFLMLGVQGAQGSSNPSVGFTPGRLLEHKSVVKPSEVFKGKKIKAFHFFYQEPSSRSLWVFLTDPVARVFQLSDPVLTREDCSQGGPFTPYVIVVFDDFTTASIELSESDWMRISYRKEAFYLKKAHLQAAVVKSP